MVGTPPVIATFSRSMISIACTGSHLRMKIVVLPPAIVPISPAEQAVTWNMGMTVRLVRGCGSGTGSPRRRKLRAAEKPPDNMLVTRLRCVPSAPFGLPVVRSEEHTSELQSLMRLSYAVFCLKKKNKKHHQTH